MWMVGNPDSCMITAVVRGQAPFCIADVSFLAEWNRILSTPFTAIYHQTCLASRIIGTCFRRYHTSLSFGLSSGLSRSLFKRGWPATRGAVRIKLSKVVNGIWTVYSLIHYLFGLRSIDDDGFPHRIYGFATAVGRCSDWTAVYFTCAIRIIRVASAVDSSPCVAVNGQWYISCPASSGVTRPQQPAFTYPTTLSRVLQVKATMKHHFDPILCSSSPTNTLILCIQTAIPQRKIIHQRSSSLKSCPYKRLL